MLFVLDENQSVGLVDSHQHGAGTRAIVAHVLPNNETHLMTWFISTMQAFWNCELRRCSLTLVDYLFGYVNTLSQCRLNETKHKLEGTTLMFVNGYSGRGYFLYYFVLFQRCFSCPFMFHMYHIFFNQHPGHSLDFLGGRGGIFFLHGGGYVRFS